MKRMAVVLAAGQGKRMKSKLYKVLHPVCGKPMVGHVTDLLRGIGTDRTVVVVGHGAEAVQAYLGDQAEYALQEQQLGTGHAVQQAEPLLGGEDGVTTVIYSDTPLVTAETLEAMLELQRREGAACVLLTAQMDNPFGLGRIVRSADGSLDRIVEQKDANAEEAAICEINAGTYCFDNRKLFAALSRVTNNNAQGEYYLTDVIAILKGQGDKVLAYCTADAAEAHGVNDRVQLSEAEAIMRQRIVRRHMLGGVTITDPSATYIEADVTIGTDAVLLPGTILRGATVIGENCRIGPQTEIVDSTVGDGCEIRYSVVTEAKLDSGVTIGPYAYLRPGTVLANQAKVGSFVETKNAVIGEGSKVPHLSYIGDARVGRGVNIGCGAITANYDGFNKAITEIADGAFIGSNVNLIAPVHIGEEAYVVAGSTITHDVGAGDLAIARERQTNKPGYARTIRERKKAAKEADAAAKKAEADSQGQG